MWLCRLAGRKVKKSVAPIHVGEVTLAGCIGLENPNIEKSSSQIALNEVEYGVPNHAAMLRLYFKIGKHGEQR